MNVFLQREKNIVHECNDQRMIDWCIQNLTEDDFIYVRGTGFGCSCEDKQGYSVYQDKDGLMVTGVCEILSCEERWEEWMSELNEHEIRVYYCHRCGEWAIDNDI
ncbi:hypothetical protein BSNK01_12540 [Bacillaceae bacterium]